MPLALAQARTALESTGGSDALAVFAAGALAADFRAEALPARAALAETLSPDDFADAALFTPALAGETFVARFDVAAPADVDLEPLDRPAADLPLAAGTAFEDPRLGRTALKLNASPFAAVAVLEPAGCEGAPESPPDNSAHRAE